MHRTVYFVSLVLILGVLHSLTHASTGMKPEDVKLLRFINNPQLQVMPDGSCAFYCVSSYVKDKDQHGSNIWQLDLKTGAYGQFTYGNSDNHPELSPNGTLLAFLSHRSDDSEIWLIRTDGGEAWQLSHFEGSIHGISWRMS